MICYQYVPGSAGIDCGAHTGQNHFSAKCLSSILFHQHDVEIHKVLSIGRATVCFPSYNEKKLSLPSRSLHHCYYGESTFSATSNAPVTVFRSSPLLPPPPPPLGQYVGV